MLTGDQKRPCKQVVKNFDTRQATPCSPDRAVNAGLPNRAHRQARARPMLTISRIVAAASCR
jgi:hypothetical protein